MPAKEAQKIGGFITELREQAGLTQEELAEALSTSQSAVARMEKANRISQLKCSPKSAKF